VPVVLPALALALGPQQQASPTLFPTIMEKLCTKPVRMVSKTSVDKFGTFRHRILQGQSLRSYLYEMQPLFIAGVPLNIRPSETHSSL